MRQVRRVLSTYPVTIGFLGFNTVILFCQLAAAQVSTSLFAFLFVGNYKITPGLLLSPFAHASILTHFLANMFLFALFGWLLEIEFKRRTYLLFILSTAYIPNIVQILRDGLVTGSAGTMGFSGVVYAVIPLSLFVAGQDWRAGTLSFNQLPFLAGAAVLTLLIPFTIADVAMLPSTGLPSAKYTHGVGFAMGLGYGVLRVYRMS
jgi:membrane associated rhomboid family serine protease